MPKEAHNFNKGGGIASTRRRGLAYCMLQVTLFPACYDADTIVGGSVQA
jgi:hypothetical protein